MLTGMCWKKREWFSAASPRMGNLWKLLKSRNIPGFSDASSIRNSNHAQCGRTHCFGILSKQHWPISKCAIVRCGFKTPLTPDSCVAPWDSASDYCDGVHPRLLHSDHIPMHVALFHQPAIVEHRDAFSATNIRAIDLAGRSYIGNWAKKLNFAVAYFFFGASVPRVIARIHNNPEGVPQPTALTKRTLHIVLLGAILDIRSQVR